LVKVGLVQVGITGGTGSQNLSFANLFSPPYVNYRIILQPTTQLTFTSYPQYSLQGFLGTGTLPINGSLYGWDLTSSAPSSLTAVYTAGATLSSAPLTFATSSTPNKQVIFDIQNVGYSTTAPQQVSLMCKSIYNNPGVQGASDRTISVITGSTATITGLSIQQTSIGFGNTMTLEADIYAYN
jgi:hypothetical protein